MKIDVYCNDGSPIGIVPPDIYGRGVGGAELSLMTWAEVMAARGHDIRIFNNPRTAGVYNAVEYCPQNAFNPNESRDVLIAWRSPFKQLAASKAAMKIHWSTDQQTIGDYATDILPVVDRVVTISPFHTGYYAKRYAAGRQEYEGKINHIDLGVRQKDYDTVWGVEKQPYQMIWASVPDRGLDLLLQMWGEILKRVPEAKLIITSDYTLWGGVATGARRYKPKWTAYRDSVRYVGAIPRLELVKYQLESTIALGSFTYDELFCISSAEAQFAGALSITGNMGALPTTNNTGIVIRTGKIKSALPALLLDLFTHRERLREAAEFSRMYATQRFDWTYIATKWEYLFRTGRFDDEE